MRKLTKNKHTTLSWFWYKAKFSARKGKFYWRPWKLLLLFILLEAESYLLTGRSLDSLHDDDPGDQGNPGPIHFQKDYYF